MEVGRAHDAGRKFHPHHVDAWFARITRNHGPLHAKAAGLVLPLNLVGKYPLKPKRVDYSANRYRKPKAQPTQTHSNQPPI
jgi:hypothetical protein